jgi:hypothetical protein
MIRYESRVRIPSTGQWTEWFRVDEERVTGSLRLMAAVFPERTVYFYMAGWSVQYRFVEEGQCAVF